MTARRRQLFVVAAALAVVAAPLWLGGAGASRDQRPAAMPSSAAEVLAGGDFVATRAMLDGVLGGDPVGTLRGIATDIHNDDHGVRIRAIRALGLYPSPQAREALKLTLIAGDPCRHDAALPPIDQLYVRAALEALGQIGDPEDVEWIVPCLKATSRDLRVAAARTLRDLGASSAVCPLQHQGAVETVPQVQLAISEALRRWPPQICPRESSVR